MMGRPTQAGGAVRAYGAAGAARGLKRQEADVFRRVTGALRAAGAADSIAFTRALADNRRLWLAVEGAVSDATNALPAPLRASIVSVGRAVLREMDGEAPDRAFLIEVNEHVAAGLEAGP